MTKSQLLQTIAERTNLTKAQVTLVFDVLYELAITTLTSKGKFLIPDLVKLSLKAKAAKPERAGVNPFTKAAITIAAKPASKKVDAKVVSELAKKFGTPASEEAAE